jgi:uncharacterized membrane protein YgdD (TMEM256/DUF423 family)
MFVGVSAGAFGAHALRGYFGSHPDLLSSYETALRYMMIHGLAILAVAWASGRWPGMVVKTVGYLFVAGILLFSGSLFALSLTGTRWFGVITPIGGAAFLTGWLILAIVAWRSQ